MKIRAYKTFNKALQSTAKAALELNVMHKDEIVRYIWIFIFFLSIDVCASDLTKSKDAKLAHILSTLEVLYKSDGFPFVEVIQTWEEISECGGSFQSCPSARLFVTSSMGDLGEAPLLYELPKSKGWEIVDTSETEHELRISLRTTLNHANVSTESRKTWRSKAYVLVVSKYSGIISVAK